MRLLVLGGTAFLGHAVATHALAEGHQVTCAARGTTGRPPEGAEFVAVDRDAADGLDALGGREFDAVLDVSSRPSHVRRALAALAGRTGHWTFVSTGSVYADEETPGQRADRAPTVAAAAPDIDDPRGNDFENYGPCKVACEEAVLAAMGEDRSFICRAGLIVGPGDTSDRFTYWPVRLARGGPVLAPGDPDDPVQLIDVRDLAEWLVGAGESGRSGVYDGIGPPMPRVRFLTEVAAGVGNPGPELVWVGQSALLDAKVVPWAGERSLPLWLPLPAFGGFMTRDVDRSGQAGLVARDLRDTSRDTLDWFQTGPRPLTCGLTAEVEAELLATWSTSVSDSE